MLWSTEITFAFWLQIKAAEWWYKTCCSTDHYPGDVNCSIQMVFKRCQKLRAQNHREYLGMGMSLTVLRRLKCLQAFEVNDHCTSPSQLEAAVGTHLKHSPFPILNTINEVRQSIPLEFKTLTSSQSWRDLQWLLSLQQTWMFFSKYGEWFCTHNFARCF